ncbi:tetratricopeptide repeat protein [Bdellovibrio svalbardensis]|uniref:Tetratricopeptide repeat protein n=1 Tax=Bdellovibrio svalbardensis TaxID=2972972 RepID=A0ABT6DJ82_9BACT|nr:tetratricopeptide repeat protein [Bdellovibrio svalbardensis]MDG0816922.1 tetratricopeptide repeat protein [Bdellovibrio svalbardensis]
MKSLVVVALTGLMLTGCLQTRNDVRDNEQRHVMQQQVSTLQKTNADVGNRFSDLEEEMRSLTGRVDVVENKLGQSNSGVESALKSSQQQNMDLSQKVVLLQDALVKMDKQMDAMNSEIQALKANQAAAASRASEVSSKKESRKDGYEAGQEFFTKKDWKQAILQYQKYRDESPKGSHFADATYKIGVAFQELGMKDEAKTFYDEVVSKYPKSEEARRAKIRIKGLKK